MHLFVVKFLKTRKVIIMLLPDNIQPELSIYYNGAIVLQNLQIKSNISLIDLYEAIKKQIDMTFSVFILSLDWLFLLDVAILNAAGKVELCS